MFTIDEPSPALSCRHFQVLTTQGHKSNHCNTQGHLSGEHQNALGDGWEVWGQPLSEEVWWIGLGQDEVRQLLSATPLTA